MATQHADLTPSAATNLTSALSLTDGVSYLVQALGSIAYLRETATAPDTATDAAHRVTPLSTWLIIQGSDPIYAWGAGQLVVTEAE